MKQDYWLYCIAVIAGVAVWTTLSLISGELEAWDSPLYFSIGIPVLCLVTAALSIVAPIRSWRWAITPLLAQAIWMLLQQGIGNLLPLGILVFVFLSIPLLISAWLGSLLAKKKP